MGWESAIPHAALRCRRPYVSIPESSWAKRWTAKLMRSIGGSSASRAASKAFCAS